MKMKVRVLFLCLTALLVSCITIDIKFVEAWSKLDYNFTQEIDENERIEVEFDDELHMVLKAYDRSGKEMLFAIDTGCQGNYLTKECLTNLDNITKTDLIFGTSFFEESSRTGCGYFIKKINIGNSSFENVLVAEVGKINNFGFTKSKKKIDGILGFDFLKRVGLFVSPTNKTIQFTNHIKNPEEYFSFSFDEEMFKKNRFAFLFKYDDKIKNCF